MPEVFSSTTRLLVRLVVMKLSVGTTSKPPSTSIISAMGNACPDSILNILFTNFIVCLLHAGY